MAQEPTPQQQAENLINGIKNTYQVVAKRHVHPWYSWALMAAAIGFTVGVAYVANSNTQFDRGRADELVTQAAQALAEEVPDNVEIATPKEAQVTVFASDGNEKVAVFIPEIKRIESDDDSLFIKILGAALIISGIPGPLDYLGVVAGDLVGSVIGASGSFFANIATSLATDAANLIISENVPLANLPGVNSNLALLAGRVSGAVDSAENAATIAKFLKGSEQNLINAEANAAVKEVKAAVKQTKKVFSQNLSKNLAKSPFLLAILDLPKIERAAIEGIRKSAGRYNPILTRNKFNLIKKAAVETVTSMRQPNSKFIKGNNSGDVRYQVVTYINDVANNTAGVITRTTIEAFAAKDKEHYLEYDRVNRPSIILPGEKNAWKATLPGSSWIGFRRNLDIAGKGPRKYTIMSAIEKFSLSSKPTEAVIGFMTTDKQTDVLVNGVKVYSVPPTKNKVITPENATFLDITDYLQVGDNKLGVYTVQAGDNNQRFGINFAGYALTQ